MIFSPIQIKKVHKEQSRNKEGQLINDKINYKKRQEQVKEKIQESFIRVKRTGGGALHKSLNFGAGDLNFNRYGESKIFLEANIQIIVLIIPSNSSELMLQISQCHNLMLLDKANEILQFYMTRHNQDKDNFPINKDLFHEIQTFYKEATFLKQQLSDNKDWIHDCNTQYFQMSYKFIPNSSNVALKFESVMKLPIINACALIYQTELFNNWVPFCKISKAIKTPGLGHKICYIMMDLPVLSNREAYIRGYGVDQLEQSKSFLICCQTIHHDKEYQALHQINTTQVNCVQVEINFFAVEVTLVNAGEFVMKSVANLDPKMKFIPQTVMNFLMKKIGKFMYERFCKLAQNIKGTQWEKAIQEQPQFYEHVRKRFEQYLSKY